MKLRLLNDAGLARWRETLEEARAAGQPVRRPPRHLLTDERFSAPASVAVDVPERPLTTARDAAETLVVILAPLPAAEVDGPAGLGNPGLWGWLALSYFASLCPGGVPGALNRYVPETVGTQAGRRYYRHLLAGPYRLYRQLGAGAGPALNTPVSEHNALYSALADHTDLAQNPALAEVMNGLYVDQITGALRRGISGADRSGSLSRFFSVLYQLELTYDLPGLTAEDLRRLLPPEFDGWEG